jgi:hypothetical protein
LELGIAIYVGPTRRKPGGRKMVRARYIVIGALAALLVIPSSADARRRGPPGIFNMMTAPLRMMMGMPRAALGVRNRHYRRAAVRPRQYYRRPPAAAIAAPAAVVPPAAAAAAATAPAGSSTATAPTVTAAPSAVPVAPTAASPAVAARDPRDTRDPRERSIRPQPAWAGALYWPSADDDVISYTLWPSGAGDKFWAHGFGDIFEAMFAPGTAAAQEPRRRAARTAAAEPCSTPPASAAASTAIEWIEKTAQPTDAQRAAFDDLKAALTKALEGIKAACPADKSLAPPDRLEAMVDRLWAMRQAVIALRAPLENFYNALTDEQKTRIDGVRAPSAEAQVSAPPKPPETVGMSAPPVGRLCSAQATAMAEWPSAPIEQALRPTDEQRTGLEMLRQVSLGMAGLLMASCPASTPATPVARLDSAQERINTVLYVVRLISPAFNNVYDSLSNEQRARFRNIGQQLGQMADPSKFADRPR